MQRVIVFVSDEQAEELTDFLIQNGLRYSTERANLSDPLDDNAPYENLLGFSQEDIRVEAEAMAIALSSMNCHRVLDLMDEDEFDISDLPETIKKVFHANPQSR